ncbi:hypothetical protein N7509_000452 [Penicillium cosmopolitanum]|uniref:DUF1772 domain-containing protein n=1 Tax=Penicillium cosmopolitanum TaxID=1131564 RepID=A0A9X0BE72_9EURO|nr:uncharacterized protein N7509_000452 [Penicillium cosmopolitanum]KAJ5413825.1 hypothetical protein N7509_000452 [Penicillium cosmopolitanum]
MNAAPGLLQSRLESDISSATLAKQWRKLAFFYLAWCVRSESSKFIQGIAGRSALYCSAAALTLSLVPYTIIVMRKTNATLIEKAKIDPRLAEKEGGEIDTLVRSWISLNSFRSLLPLAGGVVGIVAAFS